MSLEQRFAASVVLTVLFLVLVVVTGLKGRRRTHVSLVVVAFGLLASSIYYAERMGALYDLESAGVITPIHLTLAKITVIAFLFPVVTGVRTWRNPAVKSLHRRVAILALVLTALTTLTGVWMILLAERLAP